MKKLLIPLFIISILAIISCGDSIETPTIATTVNLSAFSASVDEGVEGGTLIGTINGSTNQGSVSYALSNVDPGGAIAIDASSGDITVADASAFDFDINQQITATATASNDGVSKDATLTITINEMEMETPKVIWTGPTVTFTKVADADPADEANQDRITDNVWITRGNDGGQIFNIKSESSANKEASPADTEWAIGSIENIDNLTFQPFRDALGKPKDQIATDLVVHLITDDIYISLKLTAWADEKNGGFAYERSSM